jgi:hypothetical protein
MAKPRLSRKTLRIAALILSCFLATYIVSYLVLSRIGMANCKAVGMGGLYFFVPEDTNTWRITNYACVTFYYPLIIIDTWMGTCEGVGCEPLWRLSGNENVQKSALQKQPFSNP